MGLKSKQHGPGNVTVQIGDGAQLSNNIIKVSGGALHEGSLFNLNTVAPATSDTSAATPDTQTLDLFRTLAGRFNLEEVTIQSKFGFCPRITRIYANFICED